LATEQYSSGNYNAATELWLELYDAGYDNYEILYNLGNAYFKMNEIPKAILFFERALLRNPGDEDIQYNLAIASGQIKDRFESIPNLFLIRWINRASLSLSSDSWAYFALTSFILCLVLALLFLFIINYKYKLLTFWLSALLILTTVVSITFSFRSRKLVYRNPQAIVLSEVVKGMSTPSESGNELFVIHAGLKVSTGERIGEWTEIRLPDGNKGWITTSSIENI